MLRALGQTDNLQTLFHPRGDFSRLPAGDFQRKGHIARHRAVGQQVKLLEHHADVLPRFSQFGGAHRGQIPAVHQHAAGIGALQQVNQAQQGGFAGAGIAHQAEDFALFDGQVGRLDGGKPLLVAGLVAFGNLFQSNHGSLPTIKTKPDVRHSGLGNSANALAGLTPASCVKSACNSAAKILQSAC